MQLKIQNSKLKMGNSHPSLLSDARFPFCISHLQFLILNL